jgi:hypothetical protein
MYGKRFEAKKYPDIVMTKSRYIEPGEGAVNYLLKQIQRDGSFHYLLSPEKGSISKGYNILRHAGTLYALYQWQNINGQRPDMVPDVAFSFLKDHMHPPFGLENMRCVVEDGTIKLGGTALMLLACTEKANAGYTRQEMQVMRQLAEFILWMQEPSGRFQAKIQKGEQQFSDFISLYYPGEAILALVRLYRIDPDARWLQCAIDGCTYLLQHPVLEKNGDRAHNHWFAIALSELFLLLRNEAYYKEFWMITGTVVGGLSDRLKGGYSSAGVATLGEAVVAGLLMEMKLGNIDKVAKLFPLADGILSHCLRMQVKKGDFSDDIAVGGIMENPGKTSIRIDYVQHTLQVINGLIEASRLEIAGQTVNR